jgi:hypothetical protein
MEHSIVPKKICVGRIPPFLFFDFSLDFFLCAHIIAIVRTAHTALIT